MDMKFKDYLGDFMDARNKEYDANSSLSEIDKQRFTHAVTNCWSVFGNAAFRKEQNAKKSAPLADAVMVALSDHPPEQVTPKAAKVREAIQNLLSNNSEFQKAFGTGTNGKGAIKTRITLARDAVAQALA
jgi:hypothetical protein